MAVYMMTSVDTIYEIIAQDTIPKQQLGSPTIEATFHGRTQLNLQCTQGAIQDKASCLASFQQQQKYLSDAAHVAAHLFNPTKTQDTRFRASLKLAAATGTIQPFGLNSESSGLAYTLALTLEWGIQKGLLQSTQSGSTDTVADTLKRTPIFATGSVPIDGHAKPIGFLLDKIQFACDAIEQQTIHCHEAHPKNRQDTTLNIDKSVNKQVPRFFILIPKGNIAEYENAAEIKHRVTELGGYTIGVDHAADAIHAIVGDAFDGGMHTQLDNGFAGLQSISYQQRHLFMGREALSQKLHDHSQLAQEQHQVLNVSGISGSGKSSAVVANLLPRLLKKTNSQHHAIFNPNWQLIHPNEFTNLDLLLTHLFLGLFPKVAPEKPSKKTSESSSEKNVEAENTKIKNKRQIKSWIALQHSPHALADSIAKYRLKSSTNNDHFERHLWIVDQYEEIFTHNSISDSVAKTLFEILSAIAQRTTIHIITVLRTEYMGMLGNQTSVDLQIPRHIQTKELEEIISLQLKYHRLTTQSAQTGTETESHTAAREQHLEHRIINDAVGKPLTSVSYLLQKMHERMLQEDSASTMLTHQHYEKTGGIDGVIAQQAELALKDITIPSNQPDSNIGSNTDSNTDNNKEHTLHLLFECLIGIDDGQAIAKAIPHQHLTYYPKAVTQGIHALMNKGLVADYGKGKTPKLRFSHDTLLNLQDGLPRWERLQQWFEANQTYLLWRQAHETKFTQWLSADSQEQHSQQHQYVIRDAQQLEIARSFEQVKFNPKFASYIEHSQNHHKKEQRKRWSKPLAAACAALLVISISVWHQYFRISTEYSDLIGEHYGVPFSINTLNKQEASQRHHHYQLNYKGQRLIKLSHFNSHSTLSNDPNRNNTAYWTYQYTEQGDLLEEKSFARSNKTLQTQRIEFTPTKNMARVRFQFHGSNTRIGEIQYQPGVLHQPKANNSQITEHRLYFDEHGYTQEKRFFNNHGVPSKNSSGIYGIQYSYNKKGSIISQQYIGQGDHLTPLNGAYKKRILRNKQGHITGQEWLDQNNQLIENTHGYAQSQRHLDLNNNIIEKRFLDTNGKATRHRSGFASVSINYNNNATQLEQINYGIDGELALHQQGFAKVRSELDSQGNIIHSRYFDRKDQLAERKEGFAQIKIGYDGSGNRIKEEYFDEHGEPTLHRNGYSQFIARYDDKGNRISQAYFDKNKQPTLHKNGFHFYRAKYDTNGNRIEEEYFGIDQKLKLNALNYAKVTSIYDARSNIIARAYYNTQQKPTVNRYGYAQQKITYDKFGNKTSISFYGKGNQPINNIYGFAKVNYTFNSNGLTTQWEYRDTQENLTLHPDGVAKVTAQYDDAGNQTLVQYYDINNELTLRKQQFAQLRLRYSTQGELLEWQFLDTHGQAIEQAAGHSKGIVNFNALGEKTGISYYNNLNQKLNLK